MCQTRVEDLLWWQVSCLRRSWFALLDALFSCLLVRSCVQLAANRLRRISSSQNDRDNFRYVDWQHIVWFQVIWLQCSDFWILVILKTYILCIICRSSWTDSYPMHCNALRSLWAPLACINNGFPALTSGWYISIEIESDTSMLPSESHKYYVCYVFSIQINPTADMFLFPESQVRPMDNSFHVDQVKLSIVSILQAKIRCI